MAFLANACFLNDLFAHFNTLNLQLQGRHKTIIDLTEKLNTFLDKSPLSVTDLHSHTSLFSRPEGFHCFNIGLSNYNQWDDRILKKASE